MSDKIGTHLYTKGPCVGVNGEGEKRTFRTRTACKKAGFRLVESLMAGVGGISPRELATEEPEEQAA